MPDFVEEDAFGSAGPTPSGHFSITAVDVHLDLRKEHCEYCSPDSWNEQTGRNAPTGKNHQTGDPVGTDSRSHEDHREIDRNVSEVKLCAPVLSVLPTTNFDRLSLSPKLIQGRVALRFFVWAHPLLSASRHVNSVSKHSTVDTSIAFEEA